GGSSARRALHAVAAASSRETASSGASGGALARSRVGGLAVVPSATARGVDGGALARDLALCFGPCDREATMLTPFQGRGLLWPGPLAVWWPPGARSSSRGFSSSPPPACWPVLSPPFSPRLRSRRRAVRALPRVQAPGARRSPGRAGRAHSSRAP